MLTTAPYLRTRRPSPTTAEFIVSTLPPMTLPLRLALAAVYLVRLVLALTILLLLYAAWAQSSYASATMPPLFDASIPSSSSPSPSTADAGLASRGTITTSTATAAAAAASTTNINDPPSLLNTPVFSLTFLQALLSSILRTRFGSLLGGVSRSLPPWVLVPASLLALSLLSLRIGAEERLLVLRGLGVQTSSSGATVFSALRTRFIPTDRIQDVLLNEAFRGFEVRHYLVVVVEGEERLVVVFPRLLPRPRVLEKVWRGARDCLYGPEGGGGAGGDATGADMGGCKEDCRP